MISTSDNIWKDRTMKSMETIAELNETICRLRKHIVTADTEHGELVLRLVVKERECERLREMYSFESRSSKKFIKEMLKKAAAGGEGK